MHNGGGGDVDIVEPEADALTLFLPERGQAVTRRSVHKDVTPNTILRSQAMPRAAAPARTSQVPTDAIPASITGTRLVSWRRRAQALDTLVRSRSARTIHLRRPVAIGFACGVAVGGLVTQLLPTPSLTPSVEAMAPTPTAPVVEAPQPSSPPVAATPVAETTQAVNAPPPSPPARPRPVPTSRPRYQGSLRIDSQPDRATVFVNNQRVGETPRGLSSLAVGSRAIRVELGGYAPWSRSIQIVADRQAIVTAILVERPTPD
jgi:hypothetical protein